MKRHQDSDTLKPFSSEENEEDEIENVRAYETNSYSIQHLVKNIDYEDWNGQGRNSEDTYKD